jgi:60S ribosomal subunit assembly/export protein LOC1
MGPTRTVKSKSTGPKAKANSGTEGGLGSKNRVSKSKPKGRPPPPKQQKTKAAQGPAKKKKRVYTDKELGIPKLNMITPVGVEKPKGKKKGKVFVDDQVS